MAAADDDYLARMMAMRYMYDDDDDYDDSCVEFLRPDGDIEGKDVLIPCTRPRQRQSQK